MEHLRAHRAAGSGTARRTRGSSGKNAEHLRMPAGRAAIGTTTAKKGTCWRSTTIIACHPTGKRSANDTHRRASGSLGPRGKPTGLPRVICPRRGDCRGRLRTRISQTPLSCVLMRVPLTRDRARNPVAPLRFARILPNRSLRFWAESGAGSDPPLIKRSTAPESELMFVLISVVRGRSQPAPAARCIPAGRPQTRLRGGWRPAASATSAMARRCRSRPPGPAPQRCGAGGPAARQRRPVPPA